MKMIRKQLMVALAALALVLTMAASSYADCQKKIALNEEAAGLAIDASGTAEVRARGDRQRFKVSMDARVDNGTTFAVFANGQLAGTITIDLGAGQLELSNADGKTLPAGVDPVCGIGSVTVQDKNGTVILSGKF